MSRTIQHPSVQVSSFVENTLTVVTLTTELAGRTVTVRGTASLAPGDKFDKTIGFEMAYGRALAKLAKRALKESWGFVDHRDQMKLANEKRLEDQQDPTQRRDLVLLARSLTHES